MKIINSPSPNFNERGCSPDFLVLHYTGMRSGADAIGRLCDPKSEVSAHYVVEEDGRIFLLVDESKRAWHAGKSYWNGIENLNSRSIGIEIVNPGHEFGYRAFPEAQMDAICNLCLDILSRHDISPRKILGHSDIAPARKQDPGELFDWRLLKQAGIGTWPEPDAQDRAWGLENFGNEENMRLALTQLGYDPHPPFGDVITAFQRHFYPEAFAIGGAPGRPDARMAARLKALLR